MPRAATASSRAGGEVQAASGGGDRALGPGEDGLVVLRVGRGRAGWAGDVGRQSQGTGTTQGVGEGLALQVEADGHVALVPGDDQGAHFGAVEGEHVTGREAAGVAGQSVPGAVRQGAVQGEADASGAAMGCQLGLGSRACRWRPAGPPATADRGRSATR